MAFREHKDQEQGAQLLQRSIVNGRLGHAYLFSGQRLETLESAARNLAKTLNCANPILREGKPVDCCDQCLPCRKINADNHPDVHWARPESKSRVVKVEQMRDLMHQMQLKASEGVHKVGVVMAADRLNENAANAFLKTLEEPPPGSVLILATTEPQRMIETILSRCLRLNFGGEALANLGPATREWLAQFSAQAAGTHKSLLGRYRLLDVLLQKLNASRERIEEALTAKSPLSHYKDAESATIERWEDELKAAVEAEYRRERSELVQAMQWWFRDVWLHSIGHAEGLASFPELAGPATVGARITSEQGLDNLKILEELQWLLQHSNVQEALALEVNLLKLHIGG
jgi:DNA polymerase III subunit delta'